MVKTCVYNMGIRILGPMGRKRQFWCKNGGKLTLGVPNCRKLKLWGIICSDKLGKKSETKHIETRDQNAPSSTPMRAASAWTGTSDASLDGVRNYHGCVHPKDPLEPSENLMGFILALVSLCRRYVHKYVCLK